MLDLINVQLPADGESTAEITVSIESGDGPVIGDTVTITTDMGSVGEITDNGDGTYTAVYTAPALVINEPTTDTITVASDETGDSATGTITLQPVPTVITMLVEPSSFIAGSGVTGAVAIAVNRGGNAVADADISLGLTRTDGGSDTGSVTDAANNGDGSYTATYTPADAAGQINLTARDMVSGVIMIASVNVNAGPAATISVTAAPTSVSSNGRAVITAAVADASGNGVGELALSGEAESGTVGEFSEGATFGSYNATYNAGTVEEAGTDTVTVSVGEHSDQVTIDLSPEPRKEVSFLIVSGTVNKQDGTGPVSGVNVEVTVGDMEPKTAVTDSNGHYDVNFGNPVSGVAGGTGDSVTVVVTDDAGEERGRDGSVLQSDELGDGTSANIMRDVNTDILARTTSLVVTGSVFREESEVPIDDVFAITVMNTTRGTEESGMTDENGMYVLTFFGADVVAETGDEIVVTASRDGSEWSSPPYSLSSEDVEAGRAMVNVPTDIKASALTLLVTGKVLFEDGTIAVGAGVTVTSINDGRGLKETGETNADGMYAVTFLTGDVVAETGDVIIVTAVHDGDAVGSMERTLSSAEVDAQRAEGVDVVTSIKASTTTLAVTGTAYYEGSTIPVGGGQTVTVVNNMNGMESTGTTEEDGTFVVPLIAFEGVAAETDDTLTITVTSEADGSGSIEHTLSAMQIDAKRAMVDVPTNIKATSSSFVVSGTAYLEDGVSGAPAGLTVKVMNETQGINAEGVTVPGGGYIVTFLEPDAAAVKTADELTFDVLVMADDETPVGETSVTLSSADVVAQRIDGIDIRTSLRADPTNEFLVYGTVRDPSGNIVGAGVKVRVTLGEQAARELETEADGSYQETFFMPGETAASVYDSVVIQAVDRSTGDSSFIAMQLASHHVLATACLCLT